MALGDAAESAGVAADSCATSPRLVGTATRQVIHVGLNKCGRHNPEFELSSDTWPQVAQPNVSWTALPGYLDKA
jgi:hypothetical protein